MWASPAKARTRPLQSIPQSRWTPMDLEQAVLELEGTHTDPIPAIEFLIAEGGSAPRVLLARLAVLQAGNKPALEFAFTPPHARLHRVHFRLPLGINSSATKLATRRIVIALGAMRSTNEFPLCLISSPAHPTTRNLAKQWLGLWPISARRRSCPCIHSRGAESLPAWPSVVQILGRQ